MKGRDEVVHGYMVHTEHTETAAVSRVTIHVTSKQRWKYTTSGAVRKRAIKSYSHSFRSIIVQELCESRGGRPGLSVLTSLLVSVDVKIY